MSLRGSLWDYDLKKNKNNSFRGSDAAIARQINIYLQTTVQRLLNSRGSTEDVRKSVNQWKMLVCKSEDIPAGLCFSWLPEGQEEISLSHQLKEHLDINLGHQFPYEQGNLCFLTNTSRN